MNWQDQKDAIKAPFQLGAEAVDIDAKVTYLSSGRDVTKNGWLCFGGKVKLLDFFFPKRARLWFS